MANTLLQDIYEIGNQMCQALQAGDLDGFHILMQRRGLLLNQLNDIRDPAVLSSEWDRLATALAEQHKILTAALSEQERRMAETLGTLQRYKGARSSYGKPAPSPGILHSDVRG